MENHQKSWGRAWESSFFSTLMSLTIMILTPLLVFYFYIAITHFGGSLTAAFFSITSWKQLISHLPKVSFRAVQIYFSWLALQLILWNLPDFLHKIFPKYLGGEQKGAVTPQGNELTYQINGLQAWIVSHLLFFLAAPTIIFDHWGEFLLLANLSGNLLALFIYIKGLWFPTNERERIFSGSWIYDFYMGLELNPRIKNFDFKLFFNGRPGIVAWTMINLSFAAAQYKMHGMITNSMILVNLLQAIYVIHFFWYETWYLKTIDICHDHFGWMLAWGDLVWLPWMYTLQGFYLVVHPVELSTFYGLFVLLFGLSGYVIFRIANRQKDLFRMSDGTCPINGKEPKFIPCTFIAADGKERQSKLLTSGLWGICRHFNYTGDLMLSLAYCLACGFDHIIPYFYFFFMSILLIHRCLRDEHRMQHKYGSAWQSYCTKVPYRLIPKVF